MTSTTKKQFATLCGTILSLLLWANIASATLITDNFNTYNAGVYLNGQGQWTGSSNEKVNNTGGNLLNGNYVGGGDVSNIRTYATTTSQSSGSQIFYWYSGTSFPASWGDLGLGFFSGDGFAHYCRYFYADLYWLGASGFGFQCNSGFNLVKEGSVANSTWFKIETEWTATQMRANFNNEGWSSWFNIGNSGSFDNIGIYGLPNGQRIDNLGEALSSSINITSPSSGTTTTIPFTISADYNKEGAIADYIQIFFFKMATTSCPAYLSADWWDNTLDYSGVGYSPQINATSGTTTIYFDNTKLTNQGGSNWCGVCQFLNYASSSVSADKCNGYKLSFSTSTIENFYPPTYPSFENYYTENGFGEWATPTAIFTSFSNGIGKITGKLLPYTSRIMSVLSQGNAQSLGQQFGSSIPTIRGYLLIIDSFFNNFPISTFLLFALVIYFAVFLWNFLARLLEIFKAIRPF